MNLLDIVSILIINFLNQNQIDFFIHLYDQLNFNFSLLICCQQKYFFARLLIHCHIKILVLSKYANSIIFC